jgi:hypothetical protein
MTLDAMPAKRCNDDGLSKLPKSGVMPSARKDSKRWVLEVSASVPTERGSSAATRSPTSPQPTIKTRWRRNRAGSAPRGDWFEGKIAGFINSRVQG